ncbi:hypothetical protein SAMN05216188_11835 [Lentzea xinjiangensis]|uniref:Uncharacterized protein n=1 Tax=Lentzea xinjiangensis TaxID=402600 RepID=A0A1H9TCZ2_9PSEU|nr:hypothetical protein [Lentzea xinjiangensis]SER94897.1 hypothetical protein SAMN05216188_11835 [Lentzea xinjiangensis]
MSSFQEIAAEVRALQDVLGELSSRTDAITREVEYEVFPRAVSVFAGAESPAALRAIDAIRAVIDSAGSFGSTVFIAQQELGVYLAEM